LFTVFNGRRFVFPFQLYNVVVDTEVTGKKLLQKGELKRRYTIIPLNKIAAHSIDDATVKRAQQLVSRSTGMSALLRKRWKK
jgi:structural maintenance of chromosome 2